MLSKNIDIELVFTQFPNDKYWKLFIDKEYWQYGPRYFDSDQSKGYLASLTKALYYNLLTINDPITIDHIMLLHGQAYHNFQSYNSLNPEVSSGIDFEMVSEDGLTELIDRIRMERLPFTIEGYNGKSGKYFPFPLDGDSRTLAKQIIANLLKLQWDKFELTRKATIKEIKGYMEQLINKFNEQNIQKANDEIKISCIIDFIQQMHQYHPFADGNGRTFIFLILNKLLIINGLSPVLIETPGRFSAFSRKELLKEVKMGQQLFTYECTQTGPKTQSLQSYLESQLNITEQEVLLDQLRFDVNQFYQSIEPSENIQMILGDVARYYFSNEFIAITDQDKIKLILERESFTPATLYEIYLNALYFRNDVLVEMIATYQYTNDSELTSKKNKLIDDVELHQLLFTSNNTSLIKIIVEILPIEGTKILAALGQELRFLSTNNEREKKTTILRTLLINQQFEIVLFLIQKLNIEELYKLFSLPIYDSNDRHLNGLQLLLLLSDENIKNYLLTRLKGPETNKINIPILISQPINNLLEPENSKLLNTNLQKFVDDFQKSNKSPYNKSQLFVHNEARQSIDEGLDGDPMKPKK